MANLVPIPWQPTLFLTPSTLGYLQRASDRLGRRLFLFDSDSAHRTYARQDFLYQGYLKKLAGVPGYEKFNPASRPDTGLRQHMRGAAFDLIDTSAAVQAACRAVGLVRDGVETWHWNDPAWASMPIIPTNTTTAASSGGTLIDNNDDPQEDEMGDRFYLIRGAVGPDMGAINDIYALIGVNYFRDLGGKSAYDETQRDLNFDAKTLNGYTPADPGVHHNEFVGLLNKFGIPAGNVGPGGCWFGPGHPMNKGASPSL